MVKYFSEILKTISPAQRLIALCMLILAVVAITVGPKFIDSVTKDTEELTTKINAQRTEINELTVRVNDLNKQLLVNQSECTNSLIAKEKEILEIVNDIERHAFTVKQAASEPMQMMRRAVVPDSNGTVLASQPPPSNQSQTTPVANKAMLQKIKSLKSKLQKDLNSK